MDIDTKMKNCGTIDAIVGKTSKISQIIESVDDEITFRRCNNRTIHDVSYLLKLRNNLHAIQQLEPDII